MLTVAASEHQQRFIQDIEREVPQSNDDEGISLLWSRIALSSYVRPILSDSDGLGLVPNSKLYLDTKLEWICSALRGRSGVDSFALLRMKDCRARSRYDSC